MQGNIKSVVLTGGPCAGKSTALCRLIEFIGGLGYPVVSVPEAASELLNNGIAPESFHDAHTFQDFLVKKILANEIFFENVLNVLVGDMKKGGVLICDRGLLDALAYVDREVYRGLLFNNGLDLDALFGKRYNAVIHLKTAACGSEKFYTTANNAARKESPEEARKLDEKTMNAWVGHPNLAIIDNEYIDFDGKINAVIGVIAQLLGTPEPLTIERKWLVETDEYIHQTAEIMQHYLNGGRDRLRKWTHGGATTYFHTQKSNVPSNERIKTERIITKAEYDSFIASDDVLCVKKTRKYFVWNNQYFRLDFFPGTKRQILEVQPTNVQREIKFPHFLNVIREVTDDVDYYNYTIAQQLARQEEIACLN